MDKELIDMLGKPIQDVAKSPFVAALKSKAKIQKIEEEYYLEFSDRGIVFIGSSDRRVSSIQMYAEEPGGYKQYAGALPAGLKFSNSRKDVRDRLGMPDKTGGDKTNSMIGYIPPWDSYEHPTHVIRFGYKKGSKEIVVVALMRPDAAPN